MSTTPAPPPLRVLISGGGVAGPAVALQLSRLPPPLRCEITVVERHPDLRASGQQIDLRGQGVVAMRRLGIESQVREVRVDEPGVRILNARGDLQAYFGSNKTGQGAQGFSAEWEIMRGALVRVLYNETKDLPNITYRFGTTVSSFEHIRDGTAVRARLSDGTEGEWDLLVGCDGLGSRTRRNMFTDGRKDILKPIGVASAFYTIPPQDDDTPDAVFCHFPGRRYILTRRDQPDCLRAYLGYRNPDERLSHAIKHGTVEEQKKAWAEAFMRDLPDEWGVKRCIEGLFTPEADDFYTQDFAQVKLDTWTEGRVVLVGDAGYCPSPMTGQGTSLALIGACVLGGEIARTCSAELASQNPDGESNNNDNNDPWAAGIPRGLAGYEKTLRPMVDIVHSENVQMGIKILMPESAWAIKLIHWTMWLMAALRIEKIAARFASDDRGSWKLPEYPELVKPKVSE